jgi:hypothetical protein
MPIEYPVMIAAIKEWVGKHKVAPSQSIEIDGQPAIKKAGFADMLAMALGDAINLAVSGGMSFLTGGGAGFAEFKSSLPEALQQTISTVTDGIKSLGTMIGDANPGGDAAATDLSSAFVNPISEAIDNFKFGLNASTETLQNMNEYAADNPFIQADLASSAFQLGETVKNTLDGFKGWVDSLAIGTGDGAFKLTDAFDYVNNKNNGILATIGIVNAPTLTDLVGTYVIKDTLIDDYLAKYTDQVTKLEAFKNLMPTVPIDVVKVRDEATGQMVDKNIWPPLSPDCQAAYGEWKTSFDALLSSAATIQTQVDSDKANVAALTAQNRALDAVGTLSTQYSAITDPAQRALYEETLHPRVRDTVQKLDSVMTAAKPNPDVPDPTS